MKMKAGLWIDHREAMAVLLSEGGEEIVHFTSNSTKLAHPSASAETEPAERLPALEPDNQRDRKVEHTLNKYYDGIIDRIHDAEAIYVSGPGEAKLEFEKRLESRGIKGRISAIESAEKMTDRQFSVKIRAIFAAPPARLKPRI